MEALAVSSNKEVPRSSRGGVTREHGLPAAGPHPGVRKSFGAAGCRPIPTDSLTLSIDSCTFIGEMVEPARATVTRRSPGVARSAVTGSESVPDLGGAR